MSTHSGPLSRGELATWVRFMSGSRSLFYALDRRLRDECGLSLDDFDVLAATQRAGDIRMSELSELVSFSPSRLTHVIQRMEKNGWVERTTAGGDRRVKMLALTNRGREVLGEAWPSHADAIRELFLDQLADQDQAAIEDTFSRIRRASRR